MVQLSSAKNKGHALRGERGAAVVEFAVTLLFLFFFFIAFMQIVQIFVGHERLSLATFVASRVYSVHGTKQARNAAYSIESGTTIIRIEEDPNPDAYNSDTIKSRVVTLEKGIDVPIDFRNILSKGGTKFVISNTVKSFFEDDPGGDN